MFVGLSLFRRSCSFSKTNDFHGFENECCIFSNIETNSAFFRKPETIWITQVGNRSFVKVRFRCCPKLDLQQGPSVERNILGTRALRGQGSRRRACSSECDGSQSQNPTVPWVGRPLGGAALVRAVPERAFLRRGAERRKRRRAQQGPSVLRVCKVRA